MSLALAMLTQRGANSHSLDSGRGLQVLLPASFVMLGALSVLTITGWNALNATGTSRRWREVAFDFAACYASSLFPEKPVRCQAQDVLDIPYTESDTSFPSSPLSDTSSESSCEIPTTVHCQSRASPAISTPPLRRPKARPCLPLLTIEPHLPMPGVLAENGIEFPHSPLNEPPILPSSRRTFKPRRKPAPAPIETVRVDYDILEDDDEPIVDFDLYTPPTPSHPSDSPPAHNSWITLKLTFKSSPFPSAMQRRFHNLSAVLTDDTMQSLAPSIYSISITIPTLSNGDVWLPQGLANPFDGRTTSADVRVDHPSVLDGCSPLRYRNLFPNLKEFKWSGALGRRYGRGSRSTGALPAPFYDITSLPFGQLRRLELQRCAVTLSDCRHILRSCPRLRVCVVDRIVDVDPSFFQHREPHSKSTASTNTANSSKEVVTAHPIFLPLCDPDNNTSSHKYGTSPSAEPLLTCPYLHTLRLRTTVDLCHFFSTFSAPALRNIRYAPVSGLVPWNGNGNVAAVQRSVSANAASTVEDLPELGCGVISVENFPWNIGWESLEMLELVVSEDMIVQEGVEELLEEIAGEEGVSVRVIAEGGCERVR